MSRKRGAIQYVGKKSTKGVVVHFDSSMNEALEKRTKLESSLRRAVKSGVIRPEFQPLYDLKTGALDGFEALARWTEVDGTNVCPSRFIPMAEETGLIVELGDQLLRKACIEAQQWPSAIGLSFNISPVQLSDKLLGLRIVQILAETGFAPSRLEIELTETALMRDVETAERVLSDLHGAGIRIALDDFGTGYSSMSQLSKFKFDKIKIDRSFISSFEQDKKQENIIKTMLGLGRGLGIKTTAEGIETEAQLKRLTSFGCDFGQGYLLGKPMPAVAAKKLVLQDMKKVG